MTAEEFKVLYILSLLKEDGETKEFIGYQLCADVLGIGINNVN